MDVVRKHMEWQVKDKCGDRIVKIILERVQQVTAPPKRKSTESHETLSSRKICLKSQDGSLQNASTSSSKPGSGSCPGLSNRPQRNKKKNYEHFFDGGNSSEEEDDIKSDASGFNSEPNEASDCEFQSPPLNKAKWKARNSKTTSTRVVTRKTQHPEAQTKAIPCLRCDLCSQKYKTTLALENHIIRVHVVDNPFECDMCCKSFLTELMLQKHIRRIHEHQNPPVIDKLFKCGICCKSFSTELLLQKHNQQKHKQKNSQKKVHNVNSVTWLQCALCPYKCLSQWGLEYHIIQVHVQDKPFKCELCIKSFMIESALKTHVRLTHAKKNFNCKLCPTQSFKDTASLKKHAETVHRGCSDHRDSETSGDTKLCPVCDTWFLTDADLAKHLNKPKSKSVMKCDICFDPVHTPCLLNQHRQNMHNEIPGADTSTRPNKLEGLVESPVEKQVPYSEKISKISASVKNLVSPKKFFCSVCFAFFSRRSDLDVHELKEKHRRWKCPICAKLFSSKQVLKDHVQAVHSDARPFKCTYEGCSKSYKHKEALRNHIHMHDPDSYSIKCDVCSKMFGTRKSMKVHLVTHTDERPFPCKFCEATYKFSKVANQHMKKCEFMSEDQRRKAVERGRLIIQQAKTWKPKILILGKWRKLPDQDVKLDESAKATSTSTSELTCATTSLNGNGTNLKLVKQEVDSKLFKPEADSKLIKQELDVKYFNDDSSVSENSSAAAASV